jgi:hypothetical protein
MRIFSLFVQVAVSTQICAAAPLSLQITIDELFRGRAVLSGNLLETKFTPLFSDRFLTFEASVGTALNKNNWFFRVLVTKLIFDTRTVFTLDSEAKHLTLPRGSPAGPNCCLHEGEASPGLIIGEFSGDISRDQRDHDNITGSDPTGSPGPAEKFDSLIHPGSIDHYDTLLSHLDDLNGTERGFATAGGQISARFDTAHVPEPGAAALLAGGLFMIWLAKKTRRRGKLQLK